MKELLTKYGWDVSRDRRRHIISMINPHGCPVTGMIIVNGERPVRRYFSLLSAYENFIDSITKHQKSKKSHLYGR